MDKLHFRNPGIEKLARADYSPDEFSAMCKLLHENNVFRFPPLSSGLFSAALVRPETESTGYKSAWVRDNVHVLNAHAVLGDRATAHRGATALCRFQYLHKKRIEAIIANPAIAENENHRPHIRFEGETLSEIDVPWAHAQNDAIGYLLWLWAWRASDGSNLDFPLEPWEVETVVLLLKYLEAVEYWRDEDSGHWEEDRKISASSIGVVVAALERLLKLERVLPPAAIELCEKLYENGQKSLREMLPFECVQNDPGKYREYDAALLFLVYPLELIAGDQAETIVRNVTENLLGPYGIKRYLRDSFYCENYESNIPEDMLTTDYSGCLNARDAHFLAGGEAQWAIFDPVISSYYGKLHKKTGQAEYRELQVWHLNRSFGHITGPDDRYGTFQCPELYYIEQGKLQCSRSSPLLWTQANLLLGIDEYSRSIHK